MKRILFVFLSTLSAVVLLFGYHTSTAGSLNASPSNQAPISSSASSGSPPDPGTTDPSASPGATTSPPGTTTQASTFTGPTADTRWGPVQVQISVASGKITDVAVLQYPDGNGRDQEINSYALPILIQDTLSAQSANIDMISGATVTSDGYVRSLQGALDEAHL